MFVVATEIFAVHFVPKGCVTRRPAVLRRGANINKWVEKILHKVNFCLWESAASPCTTPTGSGWGVHSDHTWQADQPWESILDEKSGIKVLYFNHLLHYLNSAVFLFSTDLKDNRTSHASLSMYNADRIRPRRPPWPCLRCCPALGVNSGWKISYFVSHLLVLPLCIYLSVINTSKFCTNYCTANICICENLQ